MSKPKKRKFWVTVPVERASGSRNYIVEADSVEEAKLIVNTGDCECYSEDLEVEKTAPMEEWDVREESK